MNKEKFKILQGLRNLILVIDKEMENCPKKDMELKNRIRNSTYDALELAYCANSTDDSKYKIDSILKIISKMKIIDFLLNISLEKSIVTQKKYLKLADQLDILEKELAGWLKYIKENNKN